VPVLGLWVLTEVDTEVGSPGSSEVWSYQWPDINSDINPSNVICDVTFGVRTHFMNFC